MRKLSVGLGILIFAFVLAVFALAVPQQSTRADTCYNSQKTPVPCADTSRHKKPTPTETFTATATDTATATATETETPKPAVLLVSTPAACIPAAPVAAVVPPPTGNSGFPFFPWLLGGGGLVLGLGIGYFTGPTTRTRTIRGIGGVDKNSDVATFLKRGDPGAGDMSVKLQKVRSDTGGNADKDQKGDVATFLKHGDSGVGDIFNKTQGTGEGSNFTATHPADGKVDASWADGSVHPSQYQKGIGNQDPNMDGDGLSSNIGDIVK